MNNLEIIFYLDGTGVYYDSYEPIHLDALLAWAYIPRKIENRNITRDDIPDDIILPLKSWKINNNWGWHASALFPNEDYSESIQYWRKKFRQNRVEKMNSSVNLKQGIYREYNTPMCLIIIDKMICYAKGNKSKIKVALKQIKYLGKKRAYGKGKIIKIKIKEIENDYSLIKDGKAMRWLPKKNGQKLVRCRPPYWNRIDRVNCCEIGEKYKLL
jgi:hypothetical protein